MVDDYPETTSSFFSFFLNLFFVMLLFCCILIFTLSSISCLFTVFVFQFTMVQHFAVNLLTWMFLSRKKILMDGREERYRTNALLFEGKTNELIIRTDTVEYWAFSPKETWNLMYQWVILIFLLSFFCFLLFRYFFLFY